MPGIRPLSPSDSLLELTGLLHRAYARLGAMGLNYTAVDQTVDVTRERVSAGQCFVADWSGKLAGTIVVQSVMAQSKCDYFLRPDVAVANQFAVEPALQGRGLGRALLDAAGTWAASRGFRFLAVDTAEPARHLIEMYRRLAYHQVAFVQWSGKRYRSVVLSKQLRHAMLRQATMADAAGLWRVRYAVTENVLPPGRLADEDLRRELEDTGRGWVIEEEGVIAAFAIANGQTGHLWALFVQPASQGRGHGSRLHDVAMQWLKEQSAPMAWLTTAQGSRACGFYERRGWVRVGIAGNGDARYELRGLVSNPGKGIAN